MKLDWDAVIRDSEFLATINRIEQRVNNLARNVNNRGRDMEAVFDRLAKTATAFLSVNMMENFLSKMISVRSEFQQLEIAFTTMLGSKEKADKLTQDLIQFAGTTPFGMKDTADATKQLLAYGSEAGNVKNELRMLGDVASGVSQPIGELVYLYGTLRTQGRAYMMDIRQFAGRGIPIYQELAKVLGVSKDQVNALVTAGKVGFKEVEQAFKNMTAQGSMFGGLMEAQSHTIQGNLERLGDAFDQMLNSMGKDSEGVIGMAISGLSTLVENYDKVLAIMLGLVTTYGVYKAALIATAAWESSLTLITTARRVAALALGTSVASLTAVEVMHYTALIIAEKAQRLLNATMLANPYIAVGAVVAGLIVTMYSLEKSLTASQQAQQNFTEGNRKAIESMEQMKAKATELTNIVRDKTATDFQTNKAYEELQRLYPNLLASMSKEQFLKEESIKLQKELNQENDKSSLSVLSNRYDEAKDKVAAITKEMEGLKVAMRNDSSGGSGAAYSKLFKELEAAKIEAGLLGGELRKQQQEYAYSLMNDDQKLQFLQAQKAEIEKQRDAILKVNPQINDQNAIFGIIQDKTVNIASNLNSWNLVRFNNELSDILGKIKSIEDANKKDPNAGVRSENWFNDEIKKLKETNAPLSVYSPEYKANLAQIKKLEDELAKAQGKEKNNSARQATQVYNAQERYLGILKDIEKTKAEYSTSQLSRDQQEIEGIKARYKVLTDEIEKFNRNPKNKKKISNGQIQEVNDTRDNEISQTKIRIQLKYDSDLLDRQKGLYDEFEEYKKQVGEQKARDRYKGLIDIDSSYIHQLESKMGEMLNIDPINMTAAQKEALQELTDRQAEYYDDLRAKENARKIEALKSAQSLSDKLLEIDKKYKDEYAALGKDITDEQKEELRKRRQEDIDSANAAESDRRTILLKGAKYWLAMTTSEIKKQVSVLKSLLASGNITGDFKEKLTADLVKLEGALSKGGKATALFALKEEAIKLNDELNILIKNGTKSGEKFDELSQKLYENGEAQKSLKVNLKGVLELIGGFAEEINELANAFSNLGDAYQNSTLRDLGSALGSIANGLKNISAVFDDELTKTEKYSAALKSLLNLVTMITNAAADRKRAEEEYYRSVTQMQNDYNIALNDQLRLQSQLGESIYLDDFAGRIKDGMKSAQDAITGYRLSVDKLLKDGKAVKGLNNAIDWKNVGNGVMSGVVMGAALGSIIPGIGNVVGAVVGGIIGGIAGLFGKKKKETYKPVYEALPKEVKDALGSDDPKDLSKIKALLESMNKEGIVDKNTQDLINNTLNWIKQIEAAREQIRQVVSDLSGNLGNELRNNLVDAFVAGGNAAKAMGETVSKVLEDMVSQLLFNRLFSDIFKDLESELTDEILNSALNGDEGGLIDVMSDFIDKAGPAAEAFGKGLEALKKAGQESGFDLFNGDNKSSGLKSSIQRDLTEATASELTGLYRSTFEITKRMAEDGQKRTALIIQGLEVSRNKLAALNAIQTNTAETVKRLDNAIGYLGSIDKNLGGRWGGSGPSMRAYGD